VTPFSLNTADRPFEPTPFTFRLAMSLAGGQPVLQQMPTTSHQACLSTSHECTYLPTPQVPTCYLALTSTFAQTSDFLCIFPGGRGFPA
jgi:hypothetical protein